jgi:hypothetical protein
MRMSKQKNKIHVQEESPFLQAMVEATRAKFGDEGGVTYMGSEINELVVGIPLPALSLMYLFDSDVFPLRRRRSPRCSSRSSAGSRDWAGTARSSSAKVTRSAQR